MKPDTEPLDEAIKLGSKVMIHAPGKSYHGKTGHVGEIRNGAFKGAPKTYTVDHDGGSIQLDKKNIKMHKEEVEQVDEISANLAGNYLDKVKAKHGNDYNALPKKRQRGVVNAMDIKMNTAEKKIKEEVHRIGLTVTDPNHPMVSKRKETIQKTVRVKGEDRDKAITGAIAHYRRQGYKVHDHHYMGRVTEESDVFAKSEENKKSADAAKKQGDMFAHHLHMADYHDNLAQWNAEKGRHSVSDTHAAKSEEHHDKAMKLKEETNMETRIWEAWSMGNRDPQKGIKVGHQVRSYDFPGMHDDHYIEGHVVGETPHSYHIRTSKVVRGGKEVPIPTHMAHVEAPKGKGMFSNAYGVHKIIAKQDSVAARPQPAQGAAKTFSAVRGKK